MSVTFYAPTPTIGCRVTCHGAATETYPSYDAAVTVLEALIANGAHPIGCADEYCLHYGNLSLFIEHVTAATSPEVNVSNVNARHLLVNLLGLGSTAEASSTDGDLVGSDFDLSGTENALSFKGRVLLALAIAPADAGIPVHAAPGPGIRMIDGGRREGWAEEKLAHLLAVCDFAIEHDAEIIWA